MRLRHAVRFTCIALIAAVAGACSGGGSPQPQAAAPKPADVPKQADVPKDVPKKAEPPKTELLPADGGDLGKAFADLQSAIAAGDQARVTKLTGPNASEWDLKGLWDAVKDYKPTGGKRQGDRATLFVAQIAPRETDNFYGAMNATHTANGWQFDDAGLINLSDTINDRPDCAATPQKYACGALTAPDSQVSGTVSEAKIDPQSNEKKILQIPLIDGFGVRMFKDRKKTPASTRIFLSGTAVSPQLLAHESNPINPLDLVGKHLLTLDIASDGKSAHGKYEAHISPDDPPSFDVRDGSGLSIDQSQPNRLRGHVIADVKDAGNLDVTFDVGIASECIYVDDACRDKDSQQ